MKKQITTTPAQWISMGWELDAQDAKSLLILEIDTMEKTIKCLADNAEGTHLDEYSFDYDSTIEDLYYEGLLRGGFPGNSAIYNDDAAKKSAHVGAASVAEIMGISAITLHLYNGFDEINQDCYGFSFQHQDETPEYEMAEYNEI